MAKRGPKGPSKWTEDELVRVGTELIEWLEADDEHVFFKQFLLQNHIYSDMLNHMVKRSDKFASLIKRAKDMQEMKLATYALKKQYPTGAIFLLKNHHGYADKKEVKTDNINRNLDTSKLMTKTSEELQDLASKLSN